jgi:hypothetical protein
MSTLKTTNLQHPSAASPAIVLDAAGDATYAGVHDFSAATVTGAGGLRLVTPTSIANSGGSASASGGAVTFTGVSSISLNGVFTSAYDNYLIVMRVTCSTSANILGRFRLSGTDASGATDYRYASVRAGSNTDTLSGTDRSDGQAFLYFGFGTTSASSIVSSIFGPNLAVSTNLIGQSTYFLTGFNIYNVGNIHIPGTAYDGISLIPSTGNATGNIRVFGYQNS